MAAIDTFHSFNAALSPKKREELNPLIKETAEELLAARSEDARIRIVDSYVKEIRERAEA